GHFADFLPNNLIDFVIILRCHPDVLLERLERRNYKREKILENIQAEILGNCSNYIVQKELSCPIFEFNTSEMDLEVLIQLILRFFEGKEDLHKYLIGNIDWLNELFETDRLNEFF
ncbi:MAG: AAA family ATPase, partial [Candidatus Lokiarchaeota archaeon]|nr:AAA family ATPase [Candidatus Lokiarchaeota archaeon]